MPHRSAARTALLLGAIALFLFALANFSPLGTFFTVLLDVTAPVVIGLIFAFIFNIPLNFIERWWIRLDKRANERGHKVLRRALSITLCFATFIGFLIALAFAVLPQIEVSLRALASALPAISVRLEEFFERVCHFLSEHGISVTPPKITLNSLLSRLRELIVGRETSLLLGSLGMATSVFLRTFDVLLAFVICIYVLAKKELLCSQARRFFSAFLQEKHSMRLFRTASLASKTFSAFISGQFVEAILLGVLCFIGMVIFRMPYAVLVSVLIGVSALVPIFGAFFGIGAGALLVLLADPQKTIWFIIFIIVLQQIETNLIYPRLMGRYVGLPAVWVLIAVSVGSSLGIIGILFSVPLFSLAYSLCAEIVRSRRGALAEAQKSTELDHP